MRYRRYGLAAFAGLALTVSACGGNDTGGNTANPPRPPNAQQDAGANKVARGEDKVPAPQDVKITSCEPNASAPQAGIEVTNRTAQVQRYAIEVLIKDPAGNTTSAYEVHNRMNPGESIPSVIPGSNALPVQGKLTCELARAERLVPKSEGG